MVLKYLVAFLSLVNGARLGEDPKTWTPKLTLTCDHCISVVNRTETVLSFHLCPRDETTACNGILRTQFSPGLVCYELGYCSQKG